MQTRKDRWQEDLFVASPLSSLIPDDYLFRRVDNVLDLSWLHEELKQHTAVGDRHRWRAEGAHGEAKTQHGLSLAVRRGTDNVAFQVYLTPKGMCFLTAPLFPAFRQREWELWE